MTPLERKAHLTLQGQSLMGEWDARCKLWAEGCKLRDEANKLWDEGLKLHKDGYKLPDAGYNMHTEGSKLRYAGNKLWANAVAAAGLTLEWVDADTCTLSNGEIYHG